MDACGHPPSLPPAGLRAGLSAGERHTELYLWAQHRALAASGFAPDKTLRELKAICQIPSDEAVFGGSWGLNHEYQNLAAEIRRKVITHAKPLGRRMGRWKVAVR